MGYALSTADIAHISEDVTSKQCKTPKSSNTRKTVEQTKLVDTLPDSYVGGALEKEFEFISEKEEYLNPIEEIEDSELKSCESITSKPQKQDYQSWVKSSLNHYSEDDINQLRTAEGTTE